MRRAPFELLLLPLVVAGAWAGCSACIMPQPGSYPMGADLAHVNRVVGEWLLARSFPQPKCGGRGQESLESYMSDEKIGGDVGEVYSWKDEHGEVHYVDDPGDVPERYRQGSKVDALPELATYHGEYSRLRTSTAGIKPIAPTRPVSVRGQVKAVVYSAEWCTACKATKAFLRGMGVTVDERDIDKDPRSLAELVALAGQDASIPVTLIGKKAIGGFDQEALRKAVNAELAGAR
jgi:glutaredoxin